MTQNGCLVGTLYSSEISFFTKKLTICDRGVWVKLL